MILRLRLCQWQLSVKNASALFTRKLSLSKSQPVLTSKLVVAHTTTILSLGHHIPTKRPSNSLRDRTDSGAVRSFEG